MQRFSALLMCFSVSKKSGISLALLLLLLFATFSSNNTTCLASKPIELNLNALPKTDPTQFVGAEKCATCHAAYFDGWKTTLHSKMFQRPIVDGPQRTILGDFDIVSPNHPALKDVKGEIVPRGEAHSVLFGQHHSWCPCLAFAGGSVQGFLEGV